MSQRILVTDDDADIRDVLRIYLHNEGYSVFEAVDGIQALELLQREPIDLIILDVMMPNMDGIQTCMAIRQHTKAPIIMLSAKGESLDKITGLHTGADDYIAKPFHPMELLARVKAQLRRQSFVEHEEHVIQTPPLVDETLITIKDLCIYPERHLVIVRGKDVLLTPTEFSILERLARRRGHVFSIDKLIELIWKEDKFITDNTVMVHIRNIREKIEENPREPQYIKTVWGVGYRIE